MLTLFAASVLLGIPQSATKPLVGLTLNVSANGGTQELIASVMEERKLGCNMLADPYKWSDLESTPGQLNLTKLKHDLTDQNNLGFVPVITIQTIDTDKRTVPTDLQNEPWDSPKMLLRSQALLREVIKTLTPSVKAVMLGNEVDGYLSSHPSQVDAYCKFLRTARVQIHQWNPTIQVGVTTMFTGIQDHPAVVRQIQQDMDIVSLTYYPLSPDFTVLPVADVPKHFSKMRALAKGRKLFLQEAGYPASPLLGSSDSKQAAFVHAVFNEIESAKGDLYAVCFFLLVDFSDATVNDLTKYYTLDSAKFRAMLGTLGFKDQHNSPRPAWVEFQARMRTAH